MSSPDPQVRAARNRSTPAAARGPVVAVTGAASGIGALLTERLAASDEVKQVIAIDERRGECAEAQWHILDVRDPAIADKLRGADVVVHLALDLDLETDPAARTAYNVRGTQTVLTAAAAAGIHRVVLCTSAGDRGGHRGRRPAGDRASRAQGASGPSRTQCHRRPPRRAGRGHRHRADQVFRVASAAGRRRFAARLAVLPRGGPVQRPGVRRPGEGRRGTRRGMRRMAGTGGGRGAQRDPAHGVAVGGRPGRGGPAAPDRTDPLPGR